MRIRTLISPIALAAALSLSGGAMAQTVIGGVDIPAEDLPEVQSLCNSLAAAANESLTETEDATADADDAADDDAADDDSDDSDDSESDPAAEDGEPSDLDQAVTSIDLDTITLEQCKEAGLVE